MHLKHDVRRIKIESGYHEYTIPKHTVVVEVWPWPHDDNLVLAKFDPSDWQRFYGDERMDDPTLLLEKTDLEDRHLDPSDPTAAEFEDLLDELLRKPTE